MANDTDLTALVFEVIAEVAPEVESELPGLDPDADLWDELGLDSMDHLAVMTRLSEATGRDIAERDYPSLTSVSQLCGHLAAGRT